MHFMPLPHGSAGILDEVLECGGLLLIVLLVYFFNATRQRNTADLPVDAQRAAAPDESEVPPMAVRDEQ